MPEKAQAALQACAHVCHTRTNVGAENISKINVTGVVATRLLQGTTELAETWMRRPALSCGSPF